MPRVAPDQVAPDFELPDFQGRPFRLSDLRGRRMALLVFNRGFA